MGNGTFRHEALLYSGEDEFLAGIMPFVEGAIAAEEPIMVAVDERKINAVKAALNGGTASVQFVDMEPLGVNPARIIPAWQEFVGSRGTEDRPIRGVGEPIWPGRSAAELVECHQHESLLNLAFAETPAFRLVCPYDVEGLPDEVIGEALRTHPLVSEGDLGRESDAYVPPEERPGPFAGELPEPATAPAELSFDRNRLRDARGFVAERASAAGLDGARGADLVLAVSELAANSVLHGGGGGTVLAWREGTSLLCEVRDSGPGLERPLAGRKRPGAEWSSGRGLWLVNHLCDLVQIRSLPGGNRVRLHMNLGRF